jgi:clan AA aspartic protease
MVTGVVNAALEGVVSFPIQDSQGLWHDIEGVVDSGYSRTLTLPPSLIRVLGLPKVSQTQLMLADGTIAAFDVYEATVNWDGHIRAIEVHESESSPLVGMRMILGYQVRIEVIVGGKLEIEILP